MLRADHHMVIYCIAVTHEMRVTVEACNTSLLMLLLDQHVIDVCPKRLKDMVDEECRVEVDS